MPNIDWTDKLDTFKALVLNDAQEKRSELMDKTHKEYDKRIDKKETELLETAYRDIQKNIREVEKEANERIMHTELDAKRRLAVRREEIISEVMAAAREGLDDFMQTADYERWLLNKTEKAVKELGDGAKTVYVCAHDMKFKDKLQAIADDITVEETAERDFFGGVRVVNREKRIAADYTLSELLAEQKKMFLRESGLSLD